MDKDREAFEKWYVENFKQNGYYAVAGNWILADKAYSSSFIQMLWRGFKAARALDAERIRELEAEIERFRKDFTKLIMGVVNKHPSETRHQTALRYIQGAEQMISNNIAMANKDADQAIKQDDTTPTATK